MLLQYDFTLLLVCLKKFCYNKNERLTLRKRSCSTLYSLKKYDETLDMLFIRKECDLGSRIESQWNEKVGQIKLCTVGSKSRSEKVAQ